MFDLESLVHLEQTFFDAGYHDGLAHGRIHGLIEGRALGRAKGFEMWDELGFYQGFALMWQAIYQQQSRNDDLSLLPQSRAISHTNRLLELISQFPRVNPSTSAIGEDVDIPQLFRQIRSRYKALCSTLGVQPSLRYSDKSLDRTEAVDPQQPKADAVWRIDNDPQRIITSGAFDF